jgi:hypothetical protein
MDRGRFRTSWDKATVHEILAVHYLGGCVERAESAIKKLSEVYGHK